MSVSYTHLVVIDPTKSATVVGSRFVPLASARRSDTKYRYCIHHDFSSSAFIFKNIEPNVAAAQIAISADTALTPVSYTHLDVYKRQML